MGGTQRKNTFLWNLSFSKNKIPVLNKFHDHQNKIEGTTILERVSYHEVRVMIISSAPRKCSNRASQIEEAHASTIGAARRGYKNRAPQL